ncbi:ABC transporter substrate-binding protein [Pseudonocardia acaciae]|uniref:ABC transporter substrate-binding protein n=1 Tax=Pseudonocardia acaciae TaxID=551276 RepID=UPI000490AD63|nr:ABC transporter substrate-binding protein [Pseudonocardia acaciae]
MQITTRRHALLAGITAAALAATGCTSGGANPAPGSAPANLTPVTVQLDYIPSGQYGAFFLAQTRGFYSEAGLDVKIVPGQGTAQVVQRIQAGAAQIGFTDLIAVASSRAQNAKVKMIAPIYQKPPYVIDTLQSGANVTDLRQLSGLTIGTGAGSFSPNVIRGVMRAAGLDPSGVRFTNIDPSTKNALLLQGKVPAIETFMTTEVSLKASAGDTKLSSLVLGDHGLSLYSNGLVATDDYLATHGDVVRKFVAATLKGWQAAAQDPGAARDAVLAAQPALDPDVSLDMVRVVNGLAVTPYTRTHGLGAIDPEEMRRSYDFIRRNLGLDGLPPVADLYSADFLPTTPVMP